MERAPGEPVRLIQFGFEMGQGNAVVLYFDTRPDAEPDGTWDNAYGDGSEVLDRPDWPVWHELPDDAKVELIGLAGERIDMGSDRAIELVGECLKEVLLAAKADGDLSPLPKATPCGLAVEHSEGYYGWPAFEEKDEPTNCV